MSDKKPTPPPYSPETQRDLARIEKSKTGVDKETEKLKRRREALEKAAEQARKPRPPR
jgi:hypothetical protein